MTFAIPGIVLGFIVAVILNYFTRKLIYDFTGNTASLSLSQGSVIMGIVLGFLIPLLSNILPIRSALGKNLRSSLDLYQRSVHEYSFAMKSQEEYGLSPAQFILSFMLVGCGILTYYFAPSAFLFQDFGMFFSIMNFILMLMILGMTYLVILVLPSLQKLILNLFLCFCRRDRKLKQIILKNLESHRNRNMKTALMFSVALSFVVFAASSFHLIGKMIISTLEASLGSDLFAISNDGSLNFMIDEGAITSFLQV